MKAKEALPSQTKTSTLTITFELPLKDTEGFRAEVLGDDKQVSDLLKAIRIHKSRIVEITIK